MRLDVRTWTCPQCGCEHDRDVNAAENLFAEGIRQLGPRDGGDLRVEGVGACPGGWRRCPRVKREAGRWRVSVRNTNEPVRSAVKMNPAHLAALDVTIG